MDMDDMNWTITLCIIICLHTVEHDGTVGLHDLRERCPSCSTMELEEDFYNCSGCGLEEIPEFPSSTTEIDLSDNNITTIGNNSFSNLFSLRILTMARNNISVIDISAFQHQEKLTVLDLSNNFLNHTPLKDTIFKNLRGLKKLSLQSNQLSIYPSGIRYLTKLIEIGLDVYEDFQFGEEFLFLHNLSIITLNPRGKFRLRNNSFEGLKNSPINNLDLSFCNSVINHIEVNYLSPFRFLSNLKILYCGLFTVTDILESLYGVRGQTLDSLIIGKHFPRSSVILSEYHLRHLKTMCIYNLVFQRNKILYFPFDKILNSALGVCLKELTFYRNNLIWNTFYGISNLLSLPSIKALSFRSTLLPMRNFLYPANLTIHHNPRFDRIYLNIKIPPSLESIDLSNNVLSESNLDAYYNMTYSLSNLKRLVLANTFFPLCNWNVNILGPHLSYLDATGSTCPFLYPNILNKCGKLKVLNVSHSELGKGFKFDINCQFLKNKTYMEVLDMSNNGLDYLCRSLFIDMATNLKQLYLNGNQFRHLPAAIRYLQRATYISFRQNALEHFDEHDLLLMDKANGTLFDFTGNIFDCSCRGISGLIWMSEKVEKLVSMEKLKCSDGRNIAYIVRNIRFVRLGCLSLSWLQLSIVGLLFATIALLLTAVGFRHKALVVYFYLRAKHYIQHTRKLAGKNDYRFDVFISYSDDEYDWVVNCLYEKLSNDFGLRVCFHEKDFQPGRSIADNIYTCVEQSRLNLFVITKAFLKSKWGRYEMEIARECVLRLREDENILVIFKEDIPVSDMPNALKKVWFRITCLKWPRNINDQEELKIFWDKLAEATVLK